MGPDHALLERRRKATGVRPSLSNINEGLCPAKPVASFPAAPPAAGVAQSGRQTGYSA
jgi:hypothetical protein